MRSESAMRRWFFAAFFALLPGGCATAPRPQAAAPPSPVAQAERPVRIAQAAPAAQPAREERPAVKLAAHQEGPEVVAPPAGLPPFDPNVYPIDLPTALQLADAESLQVALARERIRQAYAYHAQAKAMWLPSLRAGVHYNKHDGPLSNIEGRIVDVSRNSLYYGAGAYTVAAGSPTIPGVYLNFHLADAVFRPLAARQFAAARQRAAQAALNDALLEVSLAYLELLRAAQEREIALETLVAADQLAKITSDYAQTGQGLKADADRLQVEVSLRRNDVVQAEEQMAVASARLAQLLRLDPGLCLVPLDPVVLPVELLPCDVDVRSLVAQGLSRRPEIMEQRYLTGEAVERLKREKYAPLLPQVLIGTSYGEYGGGRGGDARDFGDRVDVDALAYWELRNLGVGDHAAQGATGSAVMQGRLRQYQVQDLVAREVVETNVQVQTRRRQIPIAEQGVAAAMNSQQRNLDRIQGGEGLPIEALQSIQALAQARREYLRSIIDANAAQFARQRALGWPVRAG